MGDARWDAPPGRRRRGESKGESLLACRGAGSKISERHVKVQAMLRFEVSPSAVLEHSPPQQPARPSFLIALKVASPI